MAKIMKKNSPQTILMGHYPYDQETEIYKYSTQYNDFGLFKSVLLKAHKGPEGPAEPIWPAGPVELAPFKGLKSRPKTVQDSVFDHRPGLLPGHTSDVGPGLLSNLQKVTGQYDIMNNNYKNR